MENETTPVEEPALEPAEEPTEEPAADSSAPGGTTEQPTEEPLPEALNGEIPTTTDGDFSYLVYDENGMPADYNTMLMDMTMLNGDRLENIFILLMVLTIILIFKLFVRK